MPDSQLKQAMLDELEWEPIKAQVEKGLVTLTGEVDWHELDQASSTAWAAPGTTSVDNEIAVI